jgi:hypothetical protein
VGQALSIRPHGCYGGGIAEDELVDWTSEALYNKAKVFALRAHNESIDSELFALWMSLSLELVARAALAKIHPALLADPKEPDNLQYAFGINPKKPPKSIVAKALFARCSVFIPDFTDKMAGHCLVVLDRRNSELHSGAAAFHGLNNSQWLPETYEAIEVLLRHLGRDFEDFLGDEHARLAQETLADRRDTIKREVQEKLAAARKAFEKLTDEQKTPLEKKAMASWMKTNSLNRLDKCPACGLEAGIGGEIVGRSPARIDEGVIVREARVLPNVLRCPYCSVILKGFQELNEAGRGSVYILIEEEDPIEFFGIDPEEYVDVDELLRNRDEDFGYSNE